MATEEPKHRVLEKRDGFEVRLYEPMVVAETRVEGEFGGGGNEGFRRIAGYIFGGNDGGRKIAMTAPVAQERRAGSRDGTKIAMTAPVAQEKTPEGWTVAFVMPSEHTMATLPKPDDPRVTLREVPARRVAAVTFSGTWGEEKFDAIARELLGKLDAAGFAPAGPPVYARYDPPWTPWFLRKNEILVPLAESRRAAGGGA
ncbi:MAG: heme-binding protein [Thermoanaerobaculia bacterium]|nr:heme-binding protein [Thermoanaerobaculia bacterium]